jgi:hypothetical protein
VWNLLVLVIVRMKEMSHEFVQSSEVPKKDPLIYGRRVIILNNHPCVLFLYFAILTLETTAWSVLL